MKRDVVFVSYRRSDSKASTNAVRQTLEKAFGDSVFVDVTDIAPGERFPDRIREVTARTAVFVVVIGPGWLNAQNPDGSRRLHDPEDWVRTEVALSLSTSGVTTLPVLVDGADLPPVDELPDVLKALTECNAQWLEHDTWESDWQEPLGVIAGLIDKERQDLAPAPDDASSAASISQTVEKGVANVGDISGGINLDFGN